MFSAEAIFRAIFEIIDTMLTINSAPIRKAMFIASIIMIAIICVAMIIAVRKEIMWRKKGIVPSTPLAAPIIIGVMDIGLAIVCVLSLIITPYGIA